jgi:hypothetical protein
VAALWPVVRATHNWWEVTEVVLATLSGAGQSRAPGGVPALWRLAAATVPVVTLAELVTRWREEAELLRSHGALEAAATKARDATELDEALRRHVLEELTIGAAAAETGYSASQLRRRFPGQRTIRRADLPRKGGQGGPDLAAAILRATKV